MKIAIAVLLGCAVLACAQESVHLSDWVGLAEDALLDASNSESPPYETLKQSDLWEERRYYEAEYAVTNVTGTPFTVAFTQGMARLYGYFLGRNEDGIRMERTTPALVRMLPTKDFSAVRANNFSIGLYLPKEYQGNAPKPKADDVKVVCVPETKAYVRAFGGFATEGKALEEALRLKTALLEDNVRNFVDKHFDLAVYDPPTKLTNRRNEIIFEAGSGLIPDNPFMRLPHQGFLTSLRALYANLFH